MPERSETSRIERIGGRLYRFSEIRNEGGQVIAQITAALQVEMTWSDVGQIAVGALMLGIPVALSEEVWGLGEVLSGGRVALIALASIIILAFFVKSLFYPNLAREHRFEFFKRVTAAYLVTLLVAILLLVLFDKGSLQDWILMLKRAVIIAFPACFAATAVDYMK